MKKLRICIPITTLLYFIFTRSVNAGAACVNVNAVGNYSVEDDNGGLGCFISPTGQIDGLDECVDPQSEINTAEITVPNGKILTIPAGLQDTQNKTVTPTILATGSIKINDGGTITFPVTNDVVFDDVKYYLSQIKVGAPLYITDADGDGHPASLTPKTIVKGPNSQRICGMSIADPGKKLAEVDIDGDDNDPNIGTCTPGNYYADADGDTFGNPNVHSTCKPPVHPGWVTNNTDCDDTQSTVFTSHAACFWDLDKDTYTNGNTAGKTCLNNASCNLATKGSLGGGVAPTDYTTGQLLNAANGADCNDSNNAVYQNLSGYVDADGDLYSYPAGAAAVNICSGASLPAGYVSAAARLGDTDCYDQNADARPNPTPPVPCSTTDRGDGSYDFNCVGGATTCGTIYNRTCSGAGGTTKTCIGYSSTNCGSTGYTYYAAATTACGATGCISASTGTDYSSCAVGSGGTNCKKSGGTSYVKTVTSGVQGCQ